MQQHTWPGKQPNSDVALGPQNACMSACSPFRGVLGPFGRERKRAKAIFTNSSGLGSRPERMQGSFKRHLICNPAAGLARHADSQGLVHVLPGLRIAFLWYLELFAVADNLYPYMVVRLLPEGRSEQP
ncbi:uncharacterized protein CLUP02_08742 [Colletotrichum lupini]|uniref:Uncharacterized protein n=1 Tax=Colletotrichum lupini TaxID=145971 RepID=A0A9Q8STN1_9PEZI|nr:uncharacterized protein CLUP02_08742 [Colletotrichum lupini]UQC83248.1 hypothetical protein CLUP02_08742 [Colletotrichum lupini]